MSEVHPKRALLEKLLEQGMVMVTLDARRPGVDVPPRLAGDAQLRLNLSYRFGLPIELNDWGVRATLTFGGMPHGCRLPWSAIYGVVSHVNAEQYLFPDEVPEDLLDGAAEEAEEAAPSPPVQARRGGFTVIEGATAAAPEPAPAAERSDAEDGQATADAPPPLAPVTDAATRRSHLRRIK